MSLLEACIEAHGGRDAFEGVHALDLVLRCRGLALATKMRPRALAETQVRVDLHAPAVTFSGLGTWRGDDARLWNETQGTPARSPAGRRTSRQRFERLSCRHVAVVKTSESEGPSRARSRSAIPAVGAG